MDAPNRPPVLPLTDIKRPARSKEEQLADKIWYAIQDEVAYNISDLAVKIDVPAKKILIKGICKTSITKAGATTATREVLISTESTSFDLKNEIIVI
jgi:hypothetical protein